MKTKNRTWRLLLSWMLCLFMVLGLMPGMSRTAKASGDVASVTFRYSTYDIDAQQRYYKVYETVNYASIAEAFTAATAQMDYEDELSEEDQANFSYYDTSIVTLLQDVELSEEITISDSITLDLNGHTFTLDENGSILEGGEYSFITIESENPGVFESAGTIDIYGLGTWTGDTCNITGGMVNFLSVDGGIVNVSGGVIISAFVNNGGAADIAFSVYGDATINELEVVPYDTNNGNKKKKLKAKISELAQIGKLKFFVVGKVDKVKGKPNLILSGGYYKEDPSALLDAYTEVAYDPDIVDTLYVYNADYHGYVLFSDMDEAHQSNYGQYDMYYEFSPDYYASCIQFERNVEAYADQTDWIADPEEYAWRVPVLKTDSTVSDAPKANSLTYTGADQDLVTAGTASGGTMKYALGTDDTTEPATGWSTSVPKKSKNGTYYVWYKSEGDALHNDSVAKCVTVSIAKVAGPAAPEGLDGVAPSVKDAADGKITGTKAGMEYSTERDFSKTANIKKITGTEVTGLKAGTYYVRIAETDTTKAGKAARVVIADGPEKEESLEEAAKNVTNENVDEKAEELKQKDSDELFEELQKDDKAVEALEKIEEAYMEKHDITEETPVSRMSELDAGKFAMTGAALNMESGSVGLKVEEASKDGFEEVASHKNMVVFDLNIVAKDADGKEVDFSEDLDIPVTVTIPIPARFDPATIQILHKHKDGTVEEVKFTVDEKERTATFTVKHFSAFAISGGAESVSMHRMYNPNSGEHFYTARAEERDMLISIGWNYEDIAWEAPVMSDIPVYRLYNPNAGDHHYTTSAGERDILVSLGWNDEGIGWYSDMDEGEVLYRLYNPNAVTGTHHYTKNAAERDYLDEIGWNYEGLSWYGVVK